MGATIGQIATARVQYHLRQTCIFLNMHLLNRPEVMVGFAQNKVDSNGKLIDEETRKIIKTMLIKPRGMDKTIGTEITLIKFVKIKSETSV